MSQRQMKLAIYGTSTGSHVAGWRHPEAIADLGANVQACGEMARMAEAAKLDFMFYADSLTMRGSDWDVLSRGAGRYVGQYEPLTLLSALSVMTKRIGLVATASTTYEEPYLLARRFASLDLLSEGRAGWNLVTSSNEDEAFNFSRDSHMAHADRYERAHEFSQVVRGLWNTWEGDAFPRDKRSGRFFDPAAMHLLNHKGKHFSVRGPLNVPRSPQGQPVIVQAGASEPGKELAAETAEVIFSSQTSFEMAKDFYGDVKGRMARYGRQESDLVMMPGVSIFVAPTEQEARERFDEVQSLVDPVVGRSFLEHMLGSVIDLSRYDDDGYLPDLPDTNAGKSNQRKLLETARRDNLTIRQLYLRLAAKGGFPIIGSTTQVCDQLEHLFRGGAADGFIVMVDFFPKGLHDFTSMVVPELQRRKLFRTEYSGTTLRSHLGLKNPADAVRKAA